MILNLLFIQSTCTDESSLKKFVYLMIQSWKTRTTSEDL